jgi:hypothetical protein
MLFAKIDRTQIVVAKKDALDDNDAKYWSRVAIEEKLQTITYLRECFYGKEATTRHPMDARKLQRVHTMFKLK